MELVNINFIMETVMTVNLERGNQKVEVDMNGQVVPHT